MIRSRLVPIVLLISLTPILFLFQNCGQGFKAMAPNVSGLASSTEPGVSPTPGPSATPPPPTEKIGLSISTLGARQGANLTFTIKLVSPQIDPVVVSYQTADGTAAQTVDYISKSGSLTFAPGETSKSMNVETLIFTAATNEKKLKLLVEAQMGSVQEATETEATINPVATVAKYKSVSSSGGSYSCGITFSDTVQCWGRYPKNIASLTGVKKIATGASFACAILSNDTVKCWGENANGQLGNGTILSSDIPSDVNGLSTVKDLSLGALHGCAITMQNEVMCWGYNWNGQLGNGKSRDATAGPLMAVSASSLKAKSLSAGNFSTCAIAEDDTVKCWGENVGLVPGTTHGAVATPQSVSGITSAKSIFTGGSHACVITKQQVLRCWGSNSSGQLGIGAGSFTNIADPLGSEQILTVMLGYSNTCAVPVSGSAKCWGVRDNDNYFHSLVDSSLPVTVPSLNGMIAYSPYCVLTPSNSVRCWGPNPSGNVGYDGIANIMDPSDVIGLSNVKSLARGDGHSCALTTAGSVKCWGANSKGQLGNGSKLNSLIPVDVENLSGVKSIAAGTSYSCAVLSDDSVRCWGALIRETVGTTSPTPIAGLTDISMVSITHDHACAATKSGSVKCWGGNIWGQLGSTGPDQTVPQQVAGLSGVKSVGTGVYSTCVLTFAGSVKCWGLNNSGGLGVSVSTLKSSTTPVDIGGIANAKELVKSRYHICVITASDSVLCWGVNNGRLGDGTTENSSTPKSPLGVGAVTSIAVGGSSTCVTLATGGVKCWGLSNEWKSDFGTIYPTLVPTDSVIPAAAKQISLSPAGTGSLFISDRNSVRQLGVITTDLQTLSGEILIPKY